MKRFPNAIKAARHLSSVDAKLGAVINEVGGVTIKLDPGISVFESLATSIVYQQLHGKAAATILSRFVNVCSKENRFPSPEAVLSTAESEMRAAGLSRNKLLAIQDLAVKVQSGVVPDLSRAQRMSDLELIEVFTQIRGIGVWTTQMFLIFKLGRTDVLPILDYGVRKGYAVVYGKKKLPTPKELEKIGEKWKPFRSAAAWYFWRALELEKFKGIKF